ncbi:MarR family winged helix-turn-helix transcriptional regulator [Megasphaera elsdenii]|jgi:DNA-binding MarR family transcriptional regulator|uniref:MarR family transcriptional regulator n=1 Tax=Megasphaera elsdenii TaxID=907 RepID=A0A2S0M9V0_MEGEL|nr:MarR family transcriptional regulator [Megasphaera elsdenii]AVO28203.1 MarR family transcriptional regulator [Megasphaera elsdenii]MCI7201176.1 MarR family transcriptional regulator [Megasphaera elsdenii]MDY4265297.1 MarR family transcriptional regulator [Megasphaera elsdenii]
MDEEALHILLMLGFHRSNREIARRIKREGLMPGQPKILEYLWFHDGASQKDISRECIIDKSTVTSLLKRMENLDLIRKETRPEDQRGINIYLTDKGWEKAKEIRKVIYATDDAMWQGIPEEEKQQFMRTFHKIIANQKKWGD